MYKTINLIIMDEINFLILKEFVRKPRLHLRTRLRLITCLTILWSDCRTFRTCRTFRIHHSELNSG